MASIDAGGGGHYCSCTVGSLLSSSRSSRLCDVSNLILASILSIPLKNSKALVIFNDNPAHYSQKMAALPDGILTDSREKDTRVEDYLNDKFQGLGDLNNLGALLTTVQTQQSQLREQVRHRVPKFITQLIGSVHSFEKLKQEPIRPVQLPRDIPRTS